MKERIEAILSTLKRRESLILVSILASSGSTPRGAGALMLVFEDGHAEGTIGGGAVEHAAHQHAVRLLHERTSDTVGYRLSREDVAGLGMVCGGDVTVYFQYLDGDACLPLFERLLDAFSENKNFWLVRRMEQNRVTAMAACDEDGHFWGDDLSGSLPAGLLKSRAVFLSGDPSYYAEPIVQAGWVYVFGGGHVSQELAPLLAHVGFTVAVFEDREAFADPALFPGVQEVILGDFQNLAASITLTEKDSAVVMTRGHQADFEILAQLLRRPMAYIGCIGSRRKIAETRIKLSELGFPDDAYYVVHSPIGLNIGAETPAEIAVCIAAEMIQCRAAAKEV